MFVLITAQSTVNRLLAGATVAILRLAQLPWLILTIYGCRGAVPHELLAERPETHRTGTFMIVSERGGTTAVNASK